MPVGLTEVESVALWAGLIVGIASVVLAIVAIYFSIEVDRRSSKSASDSLRALERIESAVSSQTRDTRDLIKVGWERMLGGVEPSRRSHGDDEVRATAAGLAAEIRADLQKSGLLAPESSGRVNKEQPQGLEQAIEDMRAALETQMNLMRIDPSGEFEFWLEHLSGLSEDGKTVAQAISRSHVTGEQVLRLQDDHPQTAAALEELRESGVLVPLEGYNADGEKVLVYWFPPGSSRIIRNVLLVLPEPDEDRLAVARQELKAVGYPDRPASETREV